MFFKLLQSAFSYYWLLPLTGVAYYGLSALLSGKKHTKVPSVGAWDVLIPAFIHNVIFARSAASLLKQGHEKVISLPRSRSISTEMQELMVVGVVCKLDLPAHP